VTERPGERHEIRPAASPAARAQRIGLLLMLASVAAFAVMGAFVKDLREHGMSTVEVMVWRTAPGLPLVWLELRWRGVSLRPRRPRVVALRTLLGCVAMSTNFWAVRHLALVQHTVVHLTQPVFVAFASPSLLRERTSRAAIVALGLALLGAAIVLLPPGGVDVSAMALAVTMPLLPGVAGLLSALASALAHITLRLATATELQSRLDPGAAADSPATVVFHFTATITIVGTAIGLLLGDFRALPAGLDLAGTASRVAAMAGVGLLGQLALSSAYSRAQAPAVAIVGYAAIPISAALDAFVWDAPIGISTGLGAAVMIVAGILLARSRPGVPAGPG
jgi:drug/metabolite transporter (DMT)-like permease